MDDDAPTLSVGFAIDFHDSFGKLKSLDDIIGSTAADAVREFERIKAASNGALNLGPATASVTAFGNAATRELANVARENARVEKSGEGMVRQMQRQAETFGKTASEIRQMRAELRAVEAESRGMTELAGRIRAASAQLDQLEASTGRLGASARRGTGSMTQLSFQLNDVATMAAMGAKPMQIFASQAGQIFQIAQMAEGGVRGFGKEVAGLALRFAPVIAAAGVAAAGLGLFVRWVNQGVTNDQITRDLGNITGGANATKQELYKLREETITWGDVTKAIFTVVGKDIRDVFISDVKGMTKDVKTTLDDLTSYLKAALAGAYAGLAGMKSYLGELEKGGITGLVKQALGQGDPDLLDKTFGEAYRRADKYLTSVGGRVRKEALQNARERAAEQIGYNNIPKPKVDRHAEQLARENEAIEAQIRNLYALADAYGVSGAAALIAEARVKAESAAIRKRGDIELFVNREIRLAIAERVRNAAQSTAALRDEADLQEKVNAQVAAGIGPAYDSAEILRDRIAELPLLAALEAANTLKGLEGVRAVEKATQALADQRAERDRLTDAQRKAALQLAQANTDDQLAYLREELRLVGATEAARTKALATLQAEQQASRNNWFGADAAAWVKSQGEIASGQYQLKLQTDAVNASLSHQADLLDTIASNVANAARGLADAFGNAGRALGDMASLFASHLADQERLRLARNADLVVAAQIKDAEKRTRREREIGAQFAAKSAAAQVGLYGDMTVAARGFFREGSDGYKLLTKAEQAFRAVEFALSVRAIAQDAVATASSIAKSGARAVAHGVEAVAKAISTLPFPANIAAGAATAAALAAIGISIAGGFGGGKNNLPKANEGTGTVLGDTEAKSESLKRSIDALKEVDTLMLSTSRGMAASLRSIDNQIGGLASLVVRGGDINASAGVTEGFKTNAIGSVLKAVVPIFGGALSSLFGSKTSVIASGLYGGAQSIGSILSGGFDASTYSDVEKKKRFLGITTGKKYSTQYGAADAGLENQFTLILRDFNNAIVAAAEPLGASTAEIQSRLNSFVVNIGKIDLKGLTGTEIQEKLTAVFGAAADNMATAAFPGFDRFQKVGEGAFETLVRVASTVESVTASLDLLGTRARTLGIDAKMGLADQFDSLGDLTSAVDAYFETYYTKQEQAAARTAQFAKVFDSLKLSMPSTLDGFRQLVEAQDLTTAAGQATYATLLQLAPAFADLKASMEGAKSAADILSERQDLERKLLEVRGDTAAIRALDLAKLDASNRALQRQIWAIQDAQEAARAADELRQAWKSVGDGIMDEVRRIRGLSGAETGGGFATLLGQFNAANTAARGGDQDAAKTLPGLSQALLKAAADAATSRQELDRIQAQTASTLEGTYEALKQFMAGATPAQSVEALLASAATTQAATTPTAANDDMAAEIRALREEVAGMRADNNSGHAATASNTGRAARTLENVTTASGGDAISVASAA